MTQAEAWQAMMDEGISPDITFQGAPIFWDRTVDEWLASKAREGREAGRPATEG